jgi:uncharacterized membrane protein
MVVKCSLSCCLFQFTLHSLHPFNNHDYAYSWAYMHLCVLCMYMMMMMMWIFNLLFSLLVFVITFDNVKLKGLIRKQDFNTLQPLL